MAATRVGVLCTAALVAAATFAYVAPATAGAAPPEFARHKIVFPSQDAWRRHHVHRDAGTALGSGPVSYHGGIDGIGVTSAQPYVYLVFWGSQWGTASTGADGYVQLSGDAQGVAPRLQAMFAGLGTNGELWSGVMTQYCEGVATGATSCSSSNPHVAYPATSAFAGVWVDTSSSAPSQATDNQIATEAVNAAGHFGNTTASSNRDAQYVVVSPSGTHPGGFNTSSGNFCAWHDYNADPTLVGGPAPSSYGDIAFTNLPYVTDMGVSCGASYVNNGSAGALDGVSIIAGHEYAETLTDPNPGGGWYDSAGYENADKCAWVGVGGSGGAQNVAFVTGSFPMQATYANDGHACEISHAIVTTTSAPVVTSSPVSQSVGVGQSVSFGAAASGVPAPTVQWQQSTDGGVTFANVSGATSTTLTFTAAAGQNGYQYRAVFSNSSGSATTSAATLTVSKLNQSIAFGALGGQVITASPVAVSASASSGLAVSFSSLTLPVCTVSGSS
ncbi:MAG TPA: hypothetical protein VN636_03550, partial [Acidimicrobiia bacterium]|nr:hypothetical protein [Acidimicrobiia bacterium]